VCISPHTLEYISSTNRVGRFDRRWIPRQEQEERHFPQLEALFEPCPDGFDCYPIGYEQYVFYPRTKTITNTVLAAVVWVDHNEFYVSICWVNGLFLN
jgi:hypothetical protein